MREIKVNFVDFWSGFNSEENFIVAALREKYRVVLDRDNPNYLFYGNFGKAHLNYTDYECIKTYYTGENLTGNFNECDYALAFDYLDFGDRYLRYPNYLMDRDIGALISRSAIDKHDVDAKMGFCNFIVSNRRADPVRDQIFHGINAYKKVDSAGRHLNNCSSVDEAVDAQGKPITKQQFQNRYKFTIASENSIHPGYTTEKLVDAFIARTVPIYWGDPLVTRDFNPEAFINMRDFANIDAVTAEVARIDQDDEAYISMLDAPVYTKSFLDAPPMRTQLVEFLQAIVDQPIETARRRPKYGYSRAKGLQSGGGLLWRLTQGWG